MTSWSRAAYCFGIGFCIEGAVWLLCPYVYTRLTALIAMLAFCIGLIAMYRGTPVRFMMMIRLHLELQAAFLGFIVGHQLFDVYPRSAIWSSAIGNLILGVVMAILVGLLGTASLLVTRWLRHFGRKVSGEDAPQME